MNVEIDRQLSYNSQILIFLKNCDHVPLCKHARDGRYLQTIEQFSDSFKRVQFLIGNFKRLTVNFIKKFFKDLQVNTFQKLTAVAKAWNMFSANNSRRKHARTNGQNASQNRLHYLTFKKFSFELHVAFWRMNRSNTKISEHTHIQSD